MLGVGVVIVGVAAEGSRASGSGRGRALRNCRPDTRAPHRTPPYRFSACAAFSGKYSGAVVSDGIAYFIPSSASNVGTGFGEVSQAFSG